ncbi:AI-2E family transporter [Lacisediminihabitans profunda]|uniref:AI-2E family transporter n=1 Tax=Lacisediminihabitans profunda TaxID=2594790 RepID=A0A5C8UN20_9MICO|nr:AI-2E family transporter [Lacisediminihabitans profunda]TXN29748.1 AI-2E family transporter [Lacisediminihabitans profunda]
MKIQNAFRVGLLGGLGVIVAIGIGSAVTTLSTILTYIGAALFLALGIDPAVSWLEKHRFPRWLAILTVLLGIIAVFVGLVFAVVPVIADQVSNLLSNLPDFIKTVTESTWITDTQKTLPSWINLNEILTNAGTWLKNNVATIGGGILSVGIGIFSGAAGFVIILILTLYFVASLSNMKRGLYRLVPASKRAAFSDLAEQITASVGRYVVGQGSIAFANGLFSFIFLSIMSIYGLKYPALFAFIAFLFALVPLVGTLTGSVIIVLSTLLLSGPGITLWVAIYYLAYMQVEAYVINPRVMSRAVKVPGAVVVIAALAGGSLLGILGALIAIPVAAAVLLIVDQVLVPRQNEL